MERRRELSNTQRKKGAAGHSEEGTRGADLRRREARSRLVELSKEEGTRVVERKG